MKRILSFLMLVAAFSFFEGCVTDSKDKDKDKEPTAAATRKPRAPKVTYHPFDSLVDITITGSKPDEEFAYWIYRDNELLEQPSFLLTENGAILYFLRDSLEEEGEHTYTVQYGRHQDSLSEKSPAYVYNYRGHSRSGWVKVTGTPQQYVIVEIRSPLEGLLGQVIVQRRIGTKGDVEVLDTLPVTEDSVLVYVDTNLVPEDTYLYYRVRGVDALTDSLLPSSPWDSLKVRNKVWKYVPAASVGVSAEEVNVSVTNFQGMLGEGRTTFYLYRNETSAKAGASMVDSLSIPGDFPGPTLRDQPDSGDFYYWVEARDPWDRASARSVPQAVHFTGRPIGPAVANISTSTNAILISPSYDSEVRSFVLQRARDTASKAVEIIDTLAASVFYPYNLTFIDRPVEDGYYYYRFVAVDLSGERTDPGAWSRSEFFHYAPVFGTLSIPIINRGDRVQAHINRNPGFIYVLSRSKSLSGKDTVGVDTLKYSDTSTTLTDVPAVGVWYYRVYQLSVSVSQEYNSSRTAPMRVDFTGKPMGPAILSIYVGTTYLTISVNQDPDALAYILERKPEGKDWTVADTISATDPNGLRDRPPQDGYWEYRVRAIHADLSTTEPGQSMRTPSPFTFGPIYSNTLSANIRNTGTSVECPSYGTYGYVFYLMRGTTPDIENATPVDSMRYPAPTSVLRDKPAIGTYYYWLRQEPTSNLNGAIYQSLPVKIVFTGLPEIVSLVKSSGGIQITYPVQPSGDTLEIFKSSGKPDDLAGYKKVTSLMYTEYPSYYTDTEVVGKPGFYHYRLSVRSSNGKVSELGAAKSIYYE